MKLQHLTVIFIIIILPISIVMSAYINSHITTIEKQTQYSTYLINSTYDAITAFQINTSKNDYSTLGDSKSRDILASVSTFYNSLGTNLGSSGYTATELQGYTPALLYTLYDGYYIYTKYYDTDEGKYTYGLKPFINYSCRYVDTDYDFVVNYTLDNTITVIGTVKGKYVTKTGHLIDIGSIPNNIRSENLSENLITLNDSGAPELMDASGNPIAKSYEYIVYNGRKVYKENDNTYFYYSSDYRKDFIQNTSEDYERIKLIFDNGNYSASEYYAEAAVFTTWVKNNLSGITADNAVDSEGNQITNFATEIGGSSKIFDTSTTNDPLKTSSIFNEHRMNVIRYSIETNLSSVIANFNNVSATGNEFAMPVIGEEEWYKIENNVCMVSFLQGLPIGSKLYNNYAVVANNTNQEMVGSDSIYIVDSNDEYHKPGCKTLMSKLDTDTNIEGAYAASDFERKSVSLTGSDSNAHTQLTGADTDDTAFFHPQNYTACYDCIVNMGDAYSIDEILTGVSADGSLIKDASGTTVDERIINKIKNKYLTALGRCRNDIYTSSLGESNYTYAVMAKDYPLCKEWHPGSYGRVYKKTNEGVAVIALAYYDTGSNVYLGPVLVSTVQDAAKYYSTQYGSGAGTTYTQGANRYGYYYRSVATDWLTKDCSFSTRLEVLNKADNPYHSLNEAAQAIIDKYFE